MALPVEATKELRSISGTSPPTPPAASPLLLSPRPRARVTCCGNKCREGERRRETTPPTPPDPHPPAASDLASAGGDARPQKPPSPLIVPAFAFSSFFLAFSTRDPDYARLPPASEGPSVSAEASISTRSAQTYTHP